MLSVNELKRTLEKNDRKYTDKEVEEIRKLMYFLARIEIKQFLKVSIQTS
jgi:hypothetical protein